jgi:hypothetical protein
MKIKTTLEEIIEYYDKLEEEIKRKYNIIQEIKREEELIIQFIKEKIKTEEEEIKFTLKLSEITSTLDNYENDLKMMRIKQEEVEKSMNDKIQEIENNSLILNLLSEENKNKFEIEKRKEENNIKYKKEENNNLKKKEEIKEENKILNLEKKIKMMNIKNNEEQYYEGSYKNKEKIKYTIKKIKSKKLLIENEINILNVI